MTRKNDAAAHAEDDKKRKEIIDIKNQAESLIFTTEKTLKDAGDKVDASTRKDIMDKVEDLKKAKDGEDADLIKRNYDTLSEAIQKVGAAMYQSASAEAPAGQGTPNGTQAGAGEQGYHHPRRAPHVPRPR